MKQLQPLVCEVYVLSAYRVPQCLQYLGVLVYGEGLLERLRGGEHLEPGCVEEAEIRGSSIWAVEVTGTTV